MRSPRYIGIVMSSIQVGSEVKMPGSPLMKVSEISDDQAHCHWYDKGAKSDWIPLAVLSIYTRPSVGFAVTRG